jgi:hypothetical protein
MVLAAELLTLSSLAGERPAEGHQQHGRHAAERQDQPASTAQSKGEPQPVSVEAQMQSCGFPASLLLEHSERTTWFYITVQLFHFSRPIDLEHQQEKDRLPEHLETFCLEITDDDCYNTRNIELGERIDRASLTIDDTALPTVQHFGPAR